MDFMRTKRIPMPCTIEPNDIDFDDPTNNVLLKICRTKSKKNDFKQCENCPLKFKCWTYREI